MIDYDVHQMSSLVIIIPRNSFMHCVEAAVSK